MNLAQLSSEHSNDYISTRTVCIFPENKFDLFVILICLQMACAVNVLTAVVPTYGLALRGRRFSAYELHSKTRVGRKDQCTFAIYHQFSIKQLNLGGPWTT